MAKLLVFMDYVQGSTGVLGSSARFDGAVRKIASGNHARHPRHVLWSFLPTGEGDWGMLFNHRDAKVLLATPEESKMSLGFPQDPTDRRAWWKMVPRGVQGHVALVPYYAQDYSVTVLNVNDAATLARSSSDNWTQAWYPRPFDTLPYVSASFDGPAVDETFYNLEIINVGGDPQNARLYLTVEDERAPESPVKIGTDPKATAAQFRLVPVGGGRILSSGSPLSTNGRASEERVYAAAGTGEIEMLNLDGSRTFINGDRVVLRSTEFLYYVSWTNNGNDLIANAWTPGPNQTFVIKKIGGTGEIKPGDSFALLAGNGRHLTDDRGRPDRPVTAAAPHLDAWETFVLGAPTPRSFRIVGKQTGHPLTFGQERNGIIPLVHRFGRNLVSFELFDRGDGMFTLRNGRGRISYEVIPSTDAGVDAGQAVGFGKSTATGIFLRLQPAPPSAWWPDAPNLTMDKYRDPVEDVTRMILGGVWSIGGAALSSVAGIPGGAAVFTILFNQLNPQKKVSTYELFKQFRADILSEVEGLIAGTAALQASGALQLARLQYLVEYLNSRRQHMDGGAGLAQTKTYAINAARSYAGALPFLTIAREANGTIKQTDANIATIRAGLPVYALCVAEYVNALQEVALLHAYQPKLVLPDVWLRMGDQYVTAAPADGVRLAGTNNPLHKAVRILHRHGKTLSHGAPVILRSPASTNITAVGGGGGALEAKTPTNQIGAFETFTIERLTNPPATVGDEIRQGDMIALKAPNGRYVSAPAAGGPLNAGAEQRGVAETFTIGIVTTPVQAEPPRAGLGADGGYVEHIQNLRTLAALRYNEVRDMFLFLLADRVSSKYITHRKDQNTSIDMRGIDPPSYFYALSFQDVAYNLVLDSVVTQGKAEWELQPKPQGWENPADDVRLQWGIDGYREYIRRIYFYFKYRYFYALRPLLTIADETQKMCDQMWRDPLMATEFSYVARTTPEYES